MKRLWAFMAFLCCSSLLSQASIRIVVTELPQYSPEHSEIYIVGNFNNWQDGQAKYQLQYDSLSKQWSIELPDSLKRLEYHFSRGNAATVEAEAQGRIRLNRIYEATSTPVDTTLFHQIEKWLDLAAEVTIKVAELPPNPPQSPRLYLSADFNGWQTNNTDFELIAKGGFYQITLPSIYDTFAYKISRGLPKAVEGGYAGGERSARLFQKSNKRPESEYIRIYSWEDISPVYWNSIEVVGLFFASLAILVLGIKSRSRSKARKVALPLLIFFSLYESALLMQGFSQSPVFSYFPYIILLPNLFWLAFPPLYQYIVSLMLWTPPQKPPVLRLKPILILLASYLFASIFLIWQFSNSAEEFVLDNGKFFYLNLAVATVVYGYWGYHWLSIQKRVKKLLRAEKIEPKTVDTKLSTIQFWQKLQLLTACLGLALGLLCFLNQAHYLSLHLLAHYLYATLWAIMGLMAIPLTQIVIANPKALDWDEPTPVSAEIEESKEVIDQQEKEELSNYDELERLMTEKAYVDPQLTLKALAERMDLPPALLSKLIKNKYHKNFNGFINGYRIAHFIKAMQSSEGKVVIGEKYLASGFNSKATFNRAFKRVTGKTPREYFKGE